MKTVKSQKPGHPKFHCGFCLEKFRSKRQRTQHAQKCKK